MNSVDSDKQGKEGFMKVDFDEFLHFYRKFMVGDDNQKSLKKKVGKKLTEAEVAEAKKLFDATDSAGNSNGLLEKEELLPLIKTLGVGVSEEQYSLIVANVIEKGDKNGDGCLDFEEFLYFYKRCLTSAEAQAKWAQKLQLRYHGSGDAKADAKKNYEAGIDS